MKSGKIAIVHDYFFQFGGAEKVVEVWLEMFPDAILYTSLFVPTKFTSSTALTKAWQEGRVRSTILQPFFNSKLMLRFFKHFFWLYPVVMSLVTVRGFDTVLISSSYPAKNVRISGRPKIIHYCHSPTRYLHNMDRETDLKTVHPILRTLIPLFTFWLKWMDVRAAKYLTNKGAIWVANSTYMKATHKHVYGVDSRLIYPPTEVKHFLKLKKQVNLADPFYYYFGRISFHKRIDILIEACARLGKKLFITGSAGYQAEMDKLKEQILMLDKQYPGTKERIQLLGRSPDDERDQLLSQAKAFLFAGKEDFGISPIEALASGTPIIMYEAGGALDYLKPGINGMFAPQQTPESFMEAINKFETSPITDEKRIRATTASLTRQTFEEQILELTADE